MAAAKLNVLHWHLSDMQSFPFNSSVHPKLAQYGAYDPVHAIYTHEDVRTVVKFATARGIRVVPEFVSRRLSGVWLSPSGLTRQSRIWCAGHARPHGVVVPRPSRASRQYKGWRDRSHSRGQLRIPGRLRWRASNAVSRQGPPPRLRRTAPGAMEHVGNQRVDGGARHQHQRGARELLAQARPRARREAWPAHHGLARPAQQRRYHWQGRDH